MFQIRVQQSGLILLVAGLVLWVGLLLLRAIGKRSPVRRQHGRFVLGWMLAGWLVGGAIGVSILDNVIYLPGEADAGLAGFGMLTGWIVGMIHGGLVLAFRSGRQAEPTAASETVDSIGPSKPEASTDHDTSEG
jgi:hypothetical protein